MITAEGGGTGGAASRRCLRRVPHSHRTRCRRFLSTFCCFSKPPAASRGIPRNWEAHPTTETAARAHSFLRACMAGGGPLFPPPALFRTTAVIR